MVVTTSLQGFLTKVFSAFTRFDRPNVVWTSVLLAFFALLACAYVSPSPASATAGINRQINFQGRLLNQQGATVPDGFYNIQFKIYQDGDGQSVGNNTGSPAGTLLWTESHLNANSQGVTIKNGFLSVQLGSINPFANQVDWNQDTIWLSMNIGNTNVSCTPFSNCAPDGEMVPMKRMTATPYSLNSGLLNGLASSNFVQLGQGVQTDAGTASSIFINKTSTGNLLQLQNAGTDIFTVTNAGDLTFGANASHTLSIATSAASTAGQQLTIAAGAGGSGTGSAGGDLVLVAGAAGGTDGNGGNLTINAGAKTGTGTDGTITIGSANTSAIALGQNTTLTTGKSLTINGDAFTDLTGSGLAIDTGALTVDATSSTGFFRNGGNSFAGSAVLGTNDNNTLAVRTNNVNRATFDTSGTLYLGDGVTSTSTGTFTLQGSAGAASSAGYTLALVGGTGGSNADGGDITLQGGAGTGTGVQGQVKFAAGGYSTTTIGAYGSNSTISQAAVDNYSSIAISASAPGLTITVPAPTTKYNGRVLYIQLTGSNSITLSPNGGSNTSMATNSVYALVWNTTTNGWLAAGTDSNGFIQNQNAVDQVANFRINGSGQLGGSLTATTSVLTAKLDAASAGALNIGDATTPTATVINLNQNTTLAADKSLTLTGGAIRPVSPTEGMLFYDTAQDKLLIYSNGKWQADRTDAILVAANNSSQADKDAADFVANGNTGSAGDGDQVQINDALTAGADKKVVLLAGTYVADATILVPNNTVLTGVGNGTVIELADLDATDNLIEATGTNRTGQVIRDLKLDGRSDLNTSGTQHGIYFLNVGSDSPIRKGATVANLTVARFRSDGIQLESSLNSTITQNTIENVSTAMAILNGSHRNTINGNQLRDSASAITLTGDNNSLVNNSVHNMSGSGISLTGSYNTLSGNTINDAHSGVYLEDAHYTSISGNTISNNDDTGIMFDGSDATHNAVSGNTISNSGGSLYNGAIYLSSGIDNTIANNTISDNDGHSSTNNAIEISSSATSTFLAGNTLGGGAINDIGTNTVYGGQSNGTTYKVQPADDFTITGSGASTVSTTSGNLTLQAGSGTVSLGTSTNLTANGALTIGSASSTALTLTSNAASTWKTTSGNLTIDSAATLNLGTIDATALSISKAGVTSTFNGHLTIATGQNFTVNGEAFTDLTGNGLTLSSGALTVDSTSSTGFFRNGGNSFGGAATLGTNDSNSLSFKTNGTSRATFSSSSNTLYMGNADATGVAASPSAFTIQATSNSGTGAGGALTIQAGNSGSAANGANLTLSGGTGGNGINGLVLLTTPTFQPYGSTQICSGASTSMTINQSSVDNFGTIRIGSSSSSLCTISLPSPTGGGAAQVGRVVYITVVDPATSPSNFILSVNGGGPGNVVSMRSNSSATMVWNGSAWAAAGASNSTTLQAAYDNTIQNSGGAELIISKTSSTNGLTIRDSTGSTAVNGALVNIQSSSAANLLSVNSNVTEYASNAGAETQSASASTFPATTWSAYGTGASITRNTTTNNNTIATGQASVGVTTSGGSSANTGVQNQIVDSNGAALALLANNHYNVSFSVRLPDGAATFTDLNVKYQYDGTTTNTVSCATNKVVAQNVWTKVNCSFTAPASGITSANVIRIEQGSTASRTFYVDNLSVTIAADYSLATDGNVDAALGSNWNAVASAAVSRSTTVGNNASSSVEVITTTTNQGVNNLLSIKPLTSTLYRVTTYLASTTNLSNNFDIRYSPDNGSTFVSCEDYNTTTISTSLTAFTKVTCYIPTSATAVTTPRVYFRQTDGTARTFYVDTFSMTLATASTPNVQVGSGTNGGPTTLFTLDRGASAPIAGDNESLLGSMYYDTSLGKLQCYEADGWGACGSSPDNIITISPEYTNAVMHGTGVGTMISDLCSDFLNINDGSSSQPTICNTNETYNFYRWTSPQASDQGYSIYVTYQLPTTFKSFTSGSTSLQARVDSTSNASVKMQIYKNRPGSSLATCGSDVTITTSANTWQAPPATGTADPSTCGFIGGDSIVFKITATSKSNANAYIGNIGFTFSNN